MTKRVGLFGGTFDPVHFGHINLTCELKEKKELDEIWFLPALKSPFRMHEHSLSAVHRKEMLSLALGDIPQFSICDLELKRLPPSYTVDTLKEILTLYPKYTFFLLLGEDSIVRLREWKEPFEIIHSTQLLIGTRPSTDLAKLLPKLGFDEEMAAAVRRGLVTIRQMDISATSIRERIKKRAYCGHLLPGKVLDYIYENQLYSMPQ